MKRLALILVIMLVFVSFLPAGSDRGRMRELELRVELLEFEVSNLESNVNFMLSSDYVDWLLSQL